MINLNTNPGLVNNHPQTETPEQTRSADRQTVDDFSSAMGRTDTERTPVNDNGPKPATPELRPSPEELFAETMGKPSNPATPPVSEEEMMIDKLFHPTDVDEVAPPVTQTGLQLDELIDEMIVRAPHGQEPDVFITIDDGPFAGGEIQMERCVDGMLHVTCYAGDQDCYSNFIDSRTTMRDTLERSGEMMVRVDVEYGHPDRIGPDEAGRRPRF